MQRRTCYFSGDVQGVGFRYTAHNIASRHAVTGFVRNLPDGRVELMLEGEEEEMDRVVQEISQRMESFVRKRIDELSPVTGEFTSFSIRH
jgi:acylphosphatase